MKKLFEGIKVFIGLMVAVAIAGFSFGLMYSIIKASVRFGASIL